MSADANVKAATHAVEAAGRMPEGTKKERNAKDYALTTAQRWLADAVAAHEQELERAKAEEKRRQEEANKKR